MRLSRSSHYGWSSATYSLFAKCRHLGRSDKLSRSVSAEYKRKVTTNDELTITRGTVNKIKVIDRAFTQQREPLEKGK